MRWEKLTNINSITDEKAGIYKIIIVDKKNNPYPIPRLLKEDAEGIIYIGKTTRIKARIKEFLSAKRHKNHSGGITYYRIVEKKLKEKYGDFMLQVHIDILPETKIDNAERKEIEKYISQYGEAPPCNSSIPKLNKK